MTYDVVATLDVPAGYLTINVDAALSGDVDPETLAGTLTAEPLAGDVAPESLTGALTVLSLTGELQSDDLDGELDC